MAMREMLAAEHQVLMFTKDCHTVYEFVFLKGLVGEKQASNAPPTIYPTL